MVRISYVWESDDLQHHISSARTMLYDDAVAGTTLDLQTVHEWLSGAEFDRAVECGCWSCLSIFGPLCFDPRGITGALNVGWASDARLVVGLEVTLPIYIVIYIL